jgi:hypothetical protein
VVTRSFEGSAVADGLPVGTVDSDDGADRYRTVRPAFDAANLDLVQVIVAPAQPSDLPSGQRPSATELPDAPRPGER